MRARMPDAAVLRHPSGPTRSRDAHQPRAARPPAAPRLRHKSQGKRVWAHGCHMPLPLILGLGGSSTALHAASGAGGVAAAEGATKGAQAASVGADAAKVRTCTGLLTTGVSWEVRNSLHTHRTARARAPTCPAAILPRVRLRGEAAAGCAPPGRNGTPRPDNSERCNPPRLHADSLCGGDERRQRDRGWYGSGAPPSPRGPLLWEGLPLRLCGRTLRVAALQKLGERAACFFMGNSRSRGPLLLCWAMQRRKRARSCTPDAVPRPPSRAGDPEGALEL